MEFADPRDAEDAQKGLDRMFLEGREVLPLLRRRLPVAICIAWPEQAAAQLSASDRSHADTSFSSRGLT